MKMKRLIIILLTICTLSVQAGVNNENQLRIGDQAPEIDLKWIKGGPFQKFEKGKVYVMEFWATWCGPCKRAMPHVTELAKKHSGKATFIGVNVWERSSYEINVKNVQDFVSEASDKMGYNVGMDDAQGTMAKSWLTAAGLTGIPATIIINQDGKVAWIGHPMEMDAPLQEIIEGKFDIISFAAKMKTRQEIALKQKQEQDKAMAYVKIFQDALKEKNYSKVISEYEELVAENPKVKTLFQEFYFAAIAHTDPKNTLQQAILAKKNPQEAASYARAFSTEDGLDKKFYQYAIDFFAGLPESIYNAQYIAKSHFKLGNVQTAYDIQKKWVDALKSFSSPAPPEFVEAEIANLKLYQNAIK